MDLGRYTERIREQLTAVAGAGTAESRDLAERMSTALDPALRLALLELLTEAAGEVSRELAPGGVDVRLRGQDPDLVVTRPPEEGAAPPAARPGGDVAIEDEPSSFRTTLRLPERLKTLVERAAAADGVSVNTWLVRAVGQALEPQQRARPRSSGDRFTGWAR